ncbi:hypothetical protein LPJ66_009635, partial [Kickxella alabastrina]
MHYPKHEGKENNDKYIGAGARFRGSEVQRVGGSEVQRVGGSEGRRFRGPEVQRLRGPQVHRSTGPQVHRSTGPQVQRYCFSTITSSAYTDSICGTSMPSCLATAIGLPKMTSCSIG